MIYKGIQNIHLSKMLNFAEHMDEIIICDIGFPIPRGVDYVDLVVKDDMPKITDVLDEVLNYFSVEKVVMANEAQYYNPQYTSEIISRFAADVEVNYVPHADFKLHSKLVKGIIRTGDYTANSNILLVSGDSGKFHRQQNG